MRFSISNDFSLINTDARGIDQFPQFNHASTSIFFYHQYISIFQYSFDENGSIDTLSLIDYALEYTGQKKFSFIGHSMGPVLAYIILMERPEYNDKMRLVVSLAPGACWKYESVPLIRLLAQNTALIKVSC